jgi:uncharacterized membrane protein YebE (DUF533 family)
MQNPISSLEESDMSLMGTLAKVALGVAAAKGIGHIVGQMKATTSQRGQGDPLSSVLGDKGQSGGGIGSLLEQLAPKKSGSAAGATGSAPSGNLDALIRGLAGVASGTAATAATSKAAAEGSFADGLDQAFQHHDEPKIPPTPQQDAVAGLMLRAMLQAAKCDGRIDEGEKKKILGMLGNASREDIAFVNRELSSPVDVPALVQQVPKGLENQVYAASVMGIDLDSEVEAQYLATLASALGMGSGEANAIHAKLGIPARFS